MKQQASPRIAPSQAERKLKSAIKPIGQTRRTFLRRSTATGLAVAAATLPAELDAQTASNPSGSWYPMSLPVSQNVDLDCDTMVNAAVAAANLRGFTAVTAATVRAYQGWNAGQRLTRQLTQTVAWQEWRTTPTEKPTKFRSLSWAYAPLIEKWDPRPASFHPTQAEKVGFYLSINGGGLADVFRLGEPYVKPAEVYALSPFPPGGQGVVAPDYVVTFATWPVPEPAGVSVNTLREEADFHVHHQSAVSAAYTMVIPTGAAPPLPPVIVMNNYLPPVPAQWTIDVKRPTEEE